MSNGLALFTATCAVISALSAAFTLFDRISERTPQAFLSRGKVYVVNPRKKNIIIRKIRFSGARGSVKKFESSMDILISPGGKAVIEEATHISSGYAVKRVALKSLFSENWSYILCVFIDRE